MPFLENRNRTMINQNRSQYLLVFLCLFLGYSAFAQSYFDQTLLPQPSGDYSVGYQAISLTDKLRQEKYSGRKKFRRIQLDIWYPAEKPENQAYVKYLNGFSSELIYDIFKSKGIRLTLLDSVKQTPTHTYNNALISVKEEQFPLIIFNPGFYFGMAPLYSAFMENLASQGYIVCSISHPYEQPYVRFTDGEEVFLKKKKSQLTYLELWLAYKLQFKKPDSPEAIDEITRNYLRKLKRFDVMMDYWMDDIQFTLDYFNSQQNNKLTNQLYSKMDLKRIGTFGQSFGGAVSGQLCLRDSRVIAGLNLDGFQFGDVIDEPIKKPFMLIQSGYNDLWNYGNSAIYAHPQADFYFLDMPKARHLVYSDAALIPDVPEENRFDMLGHVNGPETLNDLNEIILAFFNIYLKGEEDPILAKQIPFDGATLKVYKTPKVENQALKNNLEE